VARSLKEALLGQYAALQEAGLAPTEVPQEDEAPLVVVESAPRGRATRSRRESVDRYLEADDLDPNGQFDRDRRKGAPRREHRGEELGRDGRRRPGGVGPGGPAGGGARGRGRGRPGEFEPEFPTPSPGGGPIGGGLSRPGGLRPGAPMGPRPPFRPGLGAPRPGGPLPPGRGVPSRTNMLQQRAEQRRRDEDDIVEMRRLLSEYGGATVDDEAMEVFSRALSDETGALPPPRIVVDAIKEAQSADPRKIGDAVRAYYRRPKPRPVMAAAPPTPAAAAPEPEPALAEEPAPAPA